MESLISFYIRIPSQQLLGFRQLIVEVFLSTFFYHVNHSIKINTVQIMYGNSPILTRKSRVGVLKVDYKSKPAEFYSFLNFYFLKHIFLFHESFPQFIDIYFY